MTDLIKEFLHVGDDTIGIELSVTNAVPLSYYDISYDSMKIHAVTLLGVDIELNDELKCEIEDYLLSEYGYQLVSLVKHVQSERG